MDDEDLTVAEPAGAFEEDVAFRVVWADTAPLEPVEEDPDLQPSL